MFRGLYNSDHKAVQHKLKSRKTTEHWESKWKVLVSFSSILTVNWKGAARNRCMMWVNFWLCGWCHHEGLGFMITGHSLMTIVCYGGVRSTCLEEVRESLDSRLTNSMRLVLKWRTWGVGSKVAILTSSHPAGGHEELELLVQPESYYIVGITEMWWASSCDSRIVMDGYRLFCKDR